MAINLMGRSVLSMDGLTPAEIRHLLRLAADLKSAKMTGTERPNLTGRNIALIFEKDSTRTRSGFEVAANDQGAHVTYMGPGGSHIGHKETIKDTARVLGRMYDAIEFRGFAHADVVTLAENAGVPVYNGLTDQSHPTQILADFMTMREFTHLHLSDIAVTFMGDIHNNVARSLALGAVKVGMDMRLCGPKSLVPDTAFLDHLSEIASQTGARLTVTDDVAKGVSGADFLYTDVWVSMGEADTVWADRIKLLMPYQINAACVAATGKPYAKVMHCLPAFHNADTEVGASIKAKFGIDAMEVTDDVFEGPASIVFDEAENRMHSIKAILVATLSG